MSVRRKSDHEVLDTLYDALQAWKRGDLKEGAVCLILQNELEPSILSDADKRWAAEVTARLSLAGD